MRKVRKRFTDESAMVLFRAPIYVFAEELMKQDSNEFYREEDRVVLLKTFLRIAKKWKFTPTECQTLLGLSAINPKSWQYWIRRAKDGKSFSRSNRSRLERIAYIISIYKFSNFLFCETNGGFTWFNSPNPALPFLGKSPFQYVLDGRIVGLYRAYAHLAAMKP